MEWQSLFVPVCPIARTVVVGQSLTFAATVTNTAHPVESLPAQSHFKIFTYQALPLSAPLWRTNVPLMAVERRR